MSTSQATILRDFVREYDLGRAGTSTSAATATTLVDSSNFAFGPGGQFPTDSPIRITSTAAAGSNVFKSKIDPSSGTITFTPSTSAVNTLSPTFVISNVVDHCDRLVEAINRGLTRRCTRQMKVPLTDIPDGDFLGTTITDNWTVTSLVGTMTQAYTTLTMANGAAQRCITLTNDASSAGSYSQSTAIDVEPGETRQFFLLMRNANSTLTTANTATLAIRDAVGNAAITPTFSMGAATTTSHAFVIVQGTYSVPTGCSKVQWRLTNTTASGVVQFANCVDNGLSQRTFVAQPHLQTEDDASTWYGINVAGDTNAIASNISFRPITDDGISFSDFGWGQAIEFDSVPCFPVFYDEYSFFLALTSDTDTTDCDEELCLLAAAIELYDMLGYGSTQTPQLSRGKMIPTSTLLKLQRAQERWRTPRIQRLLAPRRINIKRNYRSRIFA